MDDDVVYHVPVMVEAVTSGLMTDLEGVYVDATIGGGGHGEAVLRVLGETGHLIACDRDPAALNEAGRRLRPHSGRVSFLQCAFSSLAQSVAPQLRRLEAAGVIGILADLGVSSHQIDEASRGFSYHQDGPLDMRMDGSAGVPAIDLLHEIGQADLVKLIRDYGEERRAKSIAAAICRRRDEGELTSTADLRNAVVSTSPQMPNKTLARVFQAIRIAVNDELGELGEFIDTCADLLLPGGRLAVIAYHSLEDRIVKTRMAPRVKGCVCPPRLPACACGQVPTFAACGRMQTAGPEEIADNPRSRSAKLRIYEKLAL
ncbi:MAG: 16S rRNA (cytosine(1402)-N(4))-methyltransferase RsmH [Gemmatimonadetes bacterium]|jgi:16S rRNA (cytosine1402-N4)-methyltransferase|nr:16S rRNA (cytosine(1402)-N(4))-methyltransferase RsmH [Gemmatimonadota bacterium]MBT7859701.1 16S rRNA (cytosine(1402)-N(4))-methyltransferase RsmH [Gemmatimonadota bacterium]